LVPTAFIFTSTATMMMNIIMMMTVATPKVIIITNKLAPWSGVLFEKLIFAQLVCLLWSPKVH
jgi:hypothetical protein